MKSSFFCLILFCFIQFSQNKLFALNRIFPPDSTSSLLVKTEAVLLIDQGKKQLNEGKVRDALITFRQAGMKDKNSWKADYWIAYCHLRLNNYGYAKQYAVSAIEKNSVEVDPEIYFILGKSSHQLGKIDSAIIAYSKALELLSKARKADLKVIKELNDCNFAQKLLSNTRNKRTPLKGEVNSGYNDYNPILLADGKRMYFTSRRPNTTGGRMNPDDQEYFEDIYRADWNNIRDQWDSVSNKIDKINSQGFDAITHISADGTKAWLTINTSILDVKNPTRSSDIFEIEFTKKGKWSNPKRIDNKSINSGFYDGSATLSADGNTMVFVSDRKAEKSLTDLYIVKKNGKEWGEAEILSDSINTTGRETTPFLSADGTLLFFSSDGHTSMGGYDIYVSKLINGNWSKAVHLGASVNSVNDDTHFKYFPQLKKAVLSSFTIKGQKSSLDLYEMNYTIMDLPEEIR